MSKEESKATVAQEILEDIQAKTELKIQNYRGNILDLYKIKVQDKDSLNSFKNIMFSLFVSVSETFSSVMNYLTYAKDWKENSATSEFKVSYLDSDGVDTELVSVILSNLLVGRPEEDGYTSISSEYKVARYLYSEIKKDPQTKSIDLNKIQTNEDGELITLGFSEGSLDSIRRDIFYILNRDQSKSETFCENTVTWETVLHDIILWEKHARLWRGVPKVAKATKVVR